LALCLLCAVVGVRVYTIVMVNAGKVEAGVDLLACVAGVALELPESVVAEHANCLSGTLNCALGRARALFLLKNPVRRCHIPADLSTLNPFRRWRQPSSAWACTCSPSWAPALAWAGFFSHPKLFRNNQPAVDEVLGKVIAQLDDVKAKVDDALPAYIKSADIINKEE
jgi:hypothetical protein